ncbi:OLC1v1001796C1 [Oldenlandia corymbosa var. corymbosa]|uniref:Probable glutathione S-transferase n=1 Tax=Oldenlandia corymbosa var. corymbosa TaxID=529605 RepID=A0AAV1D8X4_OLDCO|nr:OLC1v1001796C1 [Oldenlandia corymbosa var. corymbosa]
MAEEVKLFRTWSSPYALRIVWALKLKGIEFETIFEDITNKSPLLLQHNPAHAKVPVLLHNGKPVCESLIILEYIDETWTHNPPLLPQDPLEKASSRFWAHFGDHKLMESIWNVFTSQGKEQEEAMATSIENLKLIDEQLKGKKFFNGNAIGYLDLALGWMANLISILEEIISVELIHTDKFPHLSSWIQNFSDDPVIIECWPPRDKMVTKFQIMRDNYLTRSICQVKPA